MSSRTRLRGEQQPCNRAHDGERSLQRPQRDIQRGGALTLSLTLSLNLSPNLSLSLSLNLILTLTLSTVSEG